MIYIISIRISVSIIIISSISITYVIIIINISITVCNAKELACSKHVHTSERILCTLHIVQCTRMLTVHSICTPELSSRVAVHTWEKEEGRGFGCMEKWFN